MKEIYKSPAFLAIPMAMVCSKSGCAVAGNYSIAPASIGVGRTTGYIDQIVAVPADITMRADKKFLYVFEPSVQLVFEFNEVAGLIVKSCAVSPHHLSKLTELLKDNFVDVPDTVLNEVYGFLVSIHTSGFRVSFL